MLGFRFVTETFSCVEVTIVVCTPSSLALLFSHLARFARFMASISALVLRFEYYSFESGIDVPSTTVVTGA